MYKLVCGIETHIELSTKAKIFCSCKNGFSAEPNTQTCPVCTGQPGTLPVLNREAVLLAVKAGLAVNCKINSKTHLDRKNYFYPDLPKAYQISQFDEPLCRDGYITLASGKKIRIERIHIEEDAGKLIHENGYTYIDYNRCGVPLIEVVSKPDLETPEEAAEYAEKLRLIMKNAGVSDCKMQEGSMRCDVNVSVHKENEEWGTRTEIKNIGSISDIVKAVRLEMLRQEKLLESGERVVQSTMRYDSAQGRVYVTRIKENSDDYRYFPEPDTVSFEVPESVVEEIRNALPESPDERFERYAKKLALPENKVSLIYGYKNVCGFFDEAVNLGASAENTINLILSTVFAVLKTEEERERFSLKISAADFAELVKLADSKKIRINKAKEILPEMLKSGKPASEYLKEEDLTTLSEDELLSLCKTAIDENPKAVDDIKCGKAKALNALLGYVMKASRGKADSSKASELILSLIKK